MILVIPEIQIINGVCSYCIKSSNEMTGFYEHLSNYPTELCKLLRVENSKSIFVNDIDSFNSKVHHINYDAILELAKTIDSPFQVMTNFKTEDEFLYLIKNNIRRIVVKDTIFKYPSLIKSLIEQYSSSYFAFYVANNNLFEDEKYKANYSALEYLKYINSIGGTRIVYHNDKWADKKEGIILDEVISYCDWNKIKITLINGIYNSKQLIELEKLNKYGVDSIILGESLFNNYFPCQELWRMIEANNKDLELKPIKD